METSIEVVTIEKMQRIEDDFNLVLKFLNSKQGERNGTLINKNQLNKITNINELNKKRIEHLIYKLIRYSILFEESWKATNKIRWHYLLYAVSGNLLTELLELLKDLEDNNGLFITNLSEKEQ